jgi:hypothetical protein
MNYGHFFQQIYNRFFVNILKTKKWKIYRGISYLWGKLILVDK